MADVCFLVYLTMLSQLCKLYCIIKLEDDCER